MNSLKEIKRGGDAEQLLNNALFVEAFTTVEDAIINKWKTSPVRDVDGQHELRLMLKLLADVKGYVVEVAQTGKLAAIAAENPAKVAIMRQPFNM